VITAVLIVLAVVGAVYFVLVPWLRMELRRKASREHRPQAHELWVQEGVLLYIEAVDPKGIELVTFDKQKQLHRWRETWGDWERRLRLRVVWFSGQRGQLA